MNHYLQAWKKSFDFKSRATRAEYWSFILINFAIILTWALCCHLFFIPEKIAATLYTLFILAQIIPCLAVGIRRMHDIGFNGWWVLINCLPAAGYIVFFIFTILDGTNGHNRFGADPKNRISSNPNRK